MEWLQSLGYLGAFIGAVLEGEILLITFVQLGRLGYLNLYLAVFSFAIGTLATDWFFFFVGRKRGRHFIENHPGLRDRFNRMDQLLGKKQKLLLIFYRFMYGFRIVLPVLFGLSSISVRTFAIYSILGNIVWIGLFSLLGYYAAEWIIARLEWIQANLIFILPAIILLGVLLWLILRKSEAKDSKIS